MKEAEVDYSSMQLGLFDKCETQPGGYIVDSLFGKMSPEYCQAIQTWTFAQFLNPLQNVKLQYLDLVDGQMQDWCEADDVMLGGESSMLNISEAPKEYFSCPNEEKGYGLSQILEKNTDVPKKYFLSAKACMGILNRSERRNKTLPPLLKKALEMQAGITKLDENKVQIQTDNIHSFKTFDEYNLSVDTKSKTLEARDFKGGAIVFRQITKEVEQTMVEQKAYAIGDGQMNQSMITDKVGTLNCMHNGGQKVIQEIGTNNDL